MEVKREDWEPTFIEAMSKGGGLVVNFLEFLKLLFLLCC